MNKTIHELNSLAQAQADDEFIIYDVSEGESKKIQVQDLNNPNYSTTEQKTGGKWIDGKPIYRRVITINVTYFGDSYITLANDTWVGNIDSIVNGGACINKIFYDNAGRYWKNNTTLSFNYGKTFNLGSSQPCDFIVEYTKTTD